MPKDFQRPAPGAKPHRKAGAPPKRQGPPRAPSASGRPSSERARSDRPRSQRVRPEGSRTDASRQDAPRQDGPRQDAPRKQWPNADRSRGGAPARAERGRPRREGAESRHPERRSWAPKGPRRAKPSAPAVPELVGPNAFVDLGVPRNMAAILAAGGITVPTPIQDLAIPAAMAGQDLLGRGRTGSGKTLAFGLPMIVALGGPAPGRPRGLILAPTRELAMQVADVLRPLAAAAKLRTQLVIGGSSYERQQRGLPRADIVVATPGRLVDLAQRGSVDLSAVRIAVLDEADHMADLGFAAEIDAIMESIPATSQVMLFSATLDREVDRLIKAYLTDPTEVSADPGGATVSTMAHHIVLVHPRDKDLVTEDLARLPVRKLVFVRTQMGADRLAEQLTAAGLAAAPLHGGLRQAVRTATLARFREGGLDILVATDVAARGIHVDAVDLVIHVDPPHGPKEYLHRSGRTARAGAAGTVVSLATLRQARMVSALTTSAGVAAPVRRTRPGDPGLAQLLPAG